MTRILVTGANGHVGANVVRSLLARGHEVVPFVRRSSNLRGLEGLGLSYRYGDLLDVESVTAAAAGCEVIVHTAAVYRFWVRKPEEVIRPALVGTSHLFEAARANGVRRIVYTSSTFAVGYSADPETLRSADDWNTTPHLAYATAKVEAEKLAWKRSKELGIPMIVLCPCGIMGPHDYGITETTGLLKRWLNGTGVTSRGGASFVDVRDVAEVHAQAVTEGQTGERYILAGENLSMREWGEIVKRLTGVEPRHMDLGRRSSWMAGGLMELASKLSNSPPVLTRAMALALIERYHYYDCAKTAQAFGFAPRSAEATIKDAIRWLLFLGALKPQVASGLGAILPPDPRWQTVLA